MKQRKSETLLVNPTEEKVSALIEQQSWVKDKTVYTRDGTAMERQVCINPTGRFMAAWQKPDWKEKITPHLHRVMEGTIKGKKGDPFGGGSMDGEIWLIRDVEA